MSWNLKLRKLFGSRIQRPTARKPRKTVRLQLEPLEDRLQPSADTLSLPQAENVVAQAASQVEQRIELIENVATQIASMVQQGIQRIETAEQNLVSFWNTVIDRFIQVADAVVQDLDHLFDIPTSQPGSGSGSGSGAANPGQNLPNQPAKPIAQQSGSGSGGGSRTSHDNPSKPGASLQPMGSGSGSLYVSFGSGSNPFPEPDPCGSSYATRNVILSQATDHDVTVDYETYDGTATAGTDYTDTIGTVTIPGGQVSSTQPIKIPILDDGDDEGVGTESFYVKLTSAQGATIGTPDISEVDITEGPQQLPTDTLRWNPCTDNNASTVTNWYDWTQGFQLQKGALGLTTSTPVQLDGTPTFQTPNDALPINWDQSFTVAGISVQDGYNATQTVYSGNTLEMDGAHVPPLIVDPSSEAYYNLEGNNNLQTDPGVADIDGEMYVNFLAAGSVTTVNGTTENYRDDIDFTTNGKVNIINGGTVNLGVPAGKNQESGSPINVLNGTLNFGDSNNNNNYSTFQLTSAAADINIQANGTMNVYETGGTPINNVIGGKDAVISNNGVVNLNGVNGAGGTIIADPLQNHAKLNVLGGDWTFSQKDATGNDLSMDAGSINLSFKPPKLFCSHGYTQTGGTFFIDTAQATFAVTGVPANFNGGTISFGLSNGVLETGGIAFNGAALKMSITGGNTTSNVINSTSCSIKNTSTITVSVVGSGGGGPWVLIKNPAGTNIVGDFSQPPGLPPGIIEDQVTNTWECSET